MVTRPRLPGIVFGWLAFLVALGGCTEDSDDIGNDGGSLGVPEGDGDGNSSGDGDGDEPLLGCKDPENWVCNPPSPGYEFACVAVCEKAIELTCNQKYEGGICILAPSGDKCQVPQTGEGCEICRSAIVSDCASSIPVDP